MSGYREHRKFAFLCLIVMTVVLLLVYQYGAVDFINNDLFSSFHIHGIAIPILLLALGLGIYASLLPDIDIGTSKVYQWTVGILLLICVAFILSDSYKYETVAILLFIVSLFWLNHRGLTHRWWIGLLFSIVVGYAFGSITIFIYSIVGYYSHLLADRW